MSEVIILEVSEQGPPGPPGANGSGGIEFPFAWGDASPRQIVIAAAGKLIYGVQIHIATAFDGVGAALTVGDAGQADRLMSVYQSDPNTVGNYTAAPSYRYGTATPLLLTINPGAGASAGAGLLTLFIEA